MKKSGRILAAALSLAMTVSLGACSSSGNAGSSPAPSPDGGGGSDSPGEVGKIALVTDVGTIDDESFNQACWEGVKSYGDANNIEYQYYQPNADSTDDRMTSIRQAVNEGASIIVMPGYLFGEAAALAQEQFPETKFVAIDVSFTDILGGSGVDTSADGFDPSTYAVSDYVKDNLYCAVFGEEQSGFLAGYGAVKDGYTDLGFLGGMSVPAVIRFGQGYVQGIDAAAEEMGVDVNVKYTYGGQFFGDANITAKMEGWYQNGTQAVFACGGGIWTSAVEAALKNNGYVIGVDVDQHYLGEDEKYAYNPFITSAVKGLQAATESALDKFFHGNWSELGGKVETLNLQASEDYVGLPTAETSWCFKTFTQEQYNEIKSKIADGTITVSSDISAMPAVGSHVTLTVVE